MGLTVEKCEVCEQYPELRKKGYGVVDTVRPLQSPRLGLPERHRFYLCVDCARIWDSIEIPLVAEELNAWLSWDHLQPRVNH